MSEQISEQVVEQPAEQPVAVVEPVVEAESADQGAVEQLHNPEGALKALKAEREARKELERKLRDFEAAEQERAKAAMSDQERAILEAKESARAEAKAEYDGKVLRARVEAKAASMNFHDPELTLSLLGDVSADVSDEDLIAALEQVAADRPYLVKQSIPKMDMGPRTGSDGQSLAGVSNDDWFRRLVDESRRG